MSAVQSPAGPGFPGSIVRLLAGLSRTREQESAPADVAVPLIKHRESSADGLPESNEKALFLLYNQLESEKQRRVESVAEEQQDDA